MDFPNATDVYKGTVKYKNTLIPRETKNTLKTLLHMINCESKKGLYSLDTDIILNKNVVQILKNKGYTVTTRMSFLFRKDGEYEAKIITISWSTKSRNN